MTKTVKIIMSAFCVIVSVLAGFVVFRYQNTSASRLPDKYSGTIENIKSTTDKENDGVDD